LFVGGLSWETDEEKLRSYFSKYGNILDCTIMRDPATGRPRGFGFVTFDSVDGVNAVLLEPTHTLDSKQIDPKHAIPRDSQSGGNRNNSSIAQYANNGGNQGYTNHNSNSGGFSKSGFNSAIDPVKDMQGDKIFVGGLPPSVADADLNSGFAQFGNIVDTKLIMDKATGRSRNFGFLQFDNDESALAAVKAGNTGSGIMIHGKRVDVRGARYSKQDPTMAGQGNAYNMMNMGGYGMMGMGMMGMQGYGMMPNYGMMGANGASGNMDYMAAMNYGGYYGNMPGFYGAQADGTGSDAGANGAGTGNVDGSNGYYGQMNMPSNGYYGAGGGPDSADGQGNDSGAANYDKQQGQGQGGYNRGSRRHGDDRGKSDRGGRDSSHRSSRRYGGSGNSGNSGKDDARSGSRSGRDRQRGSDHGSSSHGGHRSRDDYRGSRGTRSNRDRDRDRDGPVRGSHASSSSRSHGFNPY
ncbi:hypothetical protein FB639_002148, partial [Coemansia asiatica]